MIILLLREKREIADGTGLYTFHIQALKKKKKKAWVLYNSRSVKVN